MAASAGLTEMSPLNGFPVLDAGPPYLILGVVVLMTYIGHKTDLLQNITPVQDKLSAQGKTISPASRGAASSAEMDHLNVRSKVVVSRMNKIIGFCGLLILQAYPVMQLFTPTTVTHFLPF